MQRVELGAGCGLKPEAWVCLRTVSLAGADGCSGAAEGQAVQGCQRTLRKGWRRYLKAALCLTSTWLLEKGHRYM